MTDKIAEDKLKEIHLAPPTYEDASKIIENMANRQQEKRKMFFRNSLIILGALAIAVFILFINYIARNNEIEPPRKDVMPPLPKPREPTWTSKESKEIDSDKNRIKPDIVVQPPGPTLGPIKVVDPPRPSPSPPVVVNPSESKGNDHEVDDDDDDSDSSESESESESNGNDEKSKAYLDDYYQVLIKKVEKLEEKLSQINWSDDTFY